MRRQSVATVSPTKIALLSATLAGLCLMVTPQISEAAHLTKSTPQSELASIKSAKWSHNVKISYPAPGEWTFSSNGLPAYGMASYYAVPNFHGPAVPTKSNSSVVAASTLDQARQSSYTLPTTPKYSSSTTTTALGPIGITVNGAVFFNPYEADSSTVALASNFTLTQNGHTGSFVDSCNGHFTPSPSLIYHYHGLPTCIANHVATKKAPALLGFAFDGFGIYNNVAEGGALVKPSSLDACNGIFSRVPGHPAGIYHYVVFNAPIKQSSLRCFHGVVSSAYTMALQREVTPLANSNTLALASARHAARTPATATSLAASTKTDDLLLGELRTSALFRWCA